jgi:hypothetical protein
LPAPSCGAARRSTRRLRAFLLLIQEKNRTTEYQSLRAVTGWQVNLTRNGKDEITNYSDPRSLSTAYARSRSPKAFETLSRLSNDPDLHKEIEYRLKGKLRRQAKKSGPSSAKQ